MIIHIGLRKTGTTFLQEKIFPSWDCQFFGPYNLTAHSFQDAIQANNFDLMNRDLKLMIPTDIDANSCAENQPILISNEGLSLPRRNSWPKLATPLDRTAKIQLKDYPFIKALKNLKKSANSLMKTPLQVLIGIRDPVALLASEYAQQSSFKLKVGQSHFENQILRYLHLKDEYCQYDKWFEVLRNTLGTENVFMYDIEILRDKLKLEVLRTKLLGTNDKVSRSETPNDPINVKKLTDESWLIRPYQGSVYLKTLVPLAKRGRLFNGIYTAGKMADRLINKSLTREPKIQVTSEIKNEIKNAFDKSQACLLSLASQHSKQFIL
jgi:hypothetical protein